MIDSELKNHLFISFQTPDLFLLHTMEKEDELPVNHLFYHNNVTHSENLFGAIERLLATVNCSFNKLTAIYVVATPGSFMSMRLAQSLIISIVTINPSIKLYITSAFLLSFYFFKEGLKQKDRFWKSIHILISRSKSKYYSLKIENNLEKNLHWFISEISSVQGRKKNMNERLMINFRTGPYENKFLFSRINIPLIIDLINNYKNEANADKLVKIISGKEVKFKDFEKLYLEKSLFLQIKNRYSYPQFSAFMELF